MDGTAKLEKTILRLDRHCKRKAREEMLDVNAERALIQALDVYRKAITEQARTDESSVKIVYTFEELTAPDSEAEPSVK
jgi:hypothetical protein